MASPCAIGFSQHEGGGGGGPLGSPVTCICLASPRVSVPADPGGSCKAPSVLF